MLCTNKNNYKENSGLKTCPDNLLWLKYLHFPKILQKCIKGNIFMTISHLYYFSLPHISLPPFLTSLAERPQPPRKLSVPQDEVEARRLHVYWVTGGSGSSALRYFTLQLKELPNGPWKTHTTDVPHNVTSWTVDRYAKTQRHTC